MNGMRLEILFVFIFPLQILVTSIEPGCHNCGCCVNDVCDQKHLQGQIVDDYCTNGCIPGISGNRCYNKCPDDCVTCEQSATSKCATCHVGKYLNYLKRCVDCPETCTGCQTTCQECKEKYFNYGQSTDCSYRCPSNCKKCTSSVKCQECFAPYYNQGDIKNCSLSCPGNCVCSTLGVCSACQNGYYNVNEQCNRACPDKCRTCSDHRNCPICNDGYFNGRESITNIEVSDCSLPCRDTCVHCTSYDSCTLCKQGYYGSYCQNDCSVGCINDECGTADGSCECKDGFTGSYCTDCATDRHGEKCDQYCPDTCKDIKCRRETGYCFECNSVNITGDTCKRCVHGSWGTYCSSVCPKNCDGQCIRISGFCNSCKGNFQGDLCNDCSLEYHGEECNKKCPDNCYNSFCYRSNGLCEKCKDNYAGLTCEDCVAGMYGEKCDVHCLLKTCSNEMCHKDTGNCISCPNGLYGLQCEFSCSSGCNDGSCNFGSGDCSGCREHYTGDKCCVEGGHCSNCSSSTVCEACDNGFYGDECNETCPTTCANAGQHLQCEKAFGKCLSCTDGFHGDTCDKTCSDRCFNSRCYKDIGHCVEGCAGDYEGPTCAQALTTNIAPVVGGGAAGCVAIIVIVILLIVVIRRRRSHANRREDYIEGKQKDSPQFPGPSQKRIDNKPIYSNDDLESAELEEDIIEDDTEDIVINIPEGREAVYENVTNATVSGLEAYVRKKTEEDYKHEFASGEIMDDTPVTRRGRGRKRGLSRGGSRDSSRGGSRGRSTDSSRGGRRGGRRGAGRGAGKSKGKSVDVTDKQRVEEMWEQRRTQMKNVVANLSRDSLNSLVLKLIDREPGLVFDLCISEEETHQPPPCGSSAPSWCRCGNCRTMPTILESKCCGCLPQNCISTRDQMERLILDPEVLVLGQRYYREMLGRHRQRVEDANKMYRHSAYRNFTLWRHGRLGAGNRRVIPSCCVFRIRETFPSATGQYTGFLANRFM